MGVVGAHPAPSLQKAVTQTFRANQATAGDAAAKAIARIWTANFSIKDARSSWAAMRPAIVAILPRFYQGSQAYGMVYYNACRLVAGFGPLPRSVAVPSVRLHADQVGHVIDPCGLGSFLHEVKNGARMMDAFVTGRDTLGSACSALVLNGARDWMAAASSADPKSNGVRRVTGGTCDWCENLASQGAKVSDGGWHNDCECTSEPAFGDDSGPSPSLPDSDVSSANSLTGSSLMNYAANFVPDSADAVMDDDATPNVLTVTVKPLTSATLKRFLEISNATAAATANGSNQ